MSVIMIRPTIKAESVGEVEAAVGQMFAAIERAEPKGVRYASCRLADGVTYVILLALDDGAENPLSEIPEFRQFQESLKNWISEPPTAEPLTVVGSYNLF